MKLDKAFEFAAILAWDDLMKVNEPRSIRVEYRAEPGTPLDYVSVRSDKGGGYLCLVCEYRTWTSSTHPSGVRFSNGYCSDQLAETLNFIMKNQDQFTGRADACRDGLVLIYPPAGEERAEAAAWMRGVPGAATRPEGVLDESALPMPPIASCIPECDRAGSAVVST
ncbi:MAG: hypothetical protein ACRD2B_07000 [Terriglobia bacterium]